MSNARPATAVINSQMHWSSPLQPNPLPNGHPLTSLACDILARQVRKIAEATPGAQADHDPECIHDLRVAIRRARHALKLFPLFATDAQCRALRNRLDRVFSLLGYVRDYDVLRAAVAHQWSGVEASATDRKTIVSMISTLRAKASSLMHAALDAPAYRRLMTDLAAVASRRAAHAPDMSLNAFAAQVIQKEMKKMHAWKDRGVRGDAAGHLHMLRIRLRQLRYACEFFEEPLGRPMKKAAQCCIVMQEIIGHHQDARASAALLCRVADRLGGQTSALLVCGALIQVQRGIEAAYHRTFKKAWAKFPARMNHRLRMEARPARPH